MPIHGGCVQAGPPVLESRRAVSGGATAARAASAGGDALPRGACTPYTHKHKHAAAGSRMGALPCYAPYTSMHSQVGEWACQRLTLGDSPCLLPQYSRRPLRGPAQPQGASPRRQSASWSPRSGEQACGQRQRHSGKSGLGRRRRPPARGTLHTVHAQAQACCSRQSHGRPPVLCT
jgi:hypothetical protein